MYTERKLRAALLSVCLSVYPFVSCPGSRKKVSRPRPPCGGLGLGGVAWFGLLAVAWRHHGLHQWRSRHLHRPRWPPRPLAAHARPGADHSGQQGG